MNIIIPERSAMVTHLYAGSHDENEGKMCVMEAVAFITGEPWSDYPKCVCPIIATFGRTWGDNLTGEERDALLLHLVPRLVGTRGSAALEERRSMMAADWLVRVNTPAWLRLAKMDTQAEALEHLPEITDMKQVPGILGLLEPLKFSTDGDSEEVSLESCAALCSAAWSAADSAAMCRMRAGAELKTWLSAEAAAWLTASSAAQWAIETTGRSALIDTEKSLQASALDLIERMIEAMVA